MQSLYYGNNDYTNFNNKANYETDLIDLSDPPFASANAAISAINPPTTPTVSSFNNDDSNAVLTGTFNLLDNLSCESQVATMSNNTATKVPPLVINISLAELISDENDRQDLKQLQEYLQRSNARFGQLMNQVSAARMYYQCVMNAYR